MDRRVTIALVAILALLGGYIWFTFLRPDAPPLTPVTPTPAAILFLDLDQTKIQSVQVQDLKTQATTRVVRAAEAWTMQAPAQGIALTGPINSLLFALSHVEANRKLDAPSDLTTYGLNPAQYQLDLTLQDGAPLTVLVGAENPGSEYSYVMKKGDPAVYLIDFALGDQIKEFVTKPPFTPTPAPTRTPEGTPAAASSTPTQLPQPTPTP